MLEDSISRKCSIPSLDPVIIDGEKE